jgi:hypothetical protein
MKIRTGFVSNSSSASFVIKKKNLTENQIRKIHDYEYHLRNLRQNNEYVDVFRYIDDYWKISENDDEISGWTNMDNVNMHRYLLAIDIKYEDINFIND